MPIKEQATKQVVINALLPTACSGVTPVNSGIIDTADYDNGIYFVMSITSWTAGAVALTIYEDDAVAMGTETIVTSLIYTSPTLDTAVTATTSIATPVGLPKLGVYSTKRYLRAKLTGTAAACDLTAQVIAIANPEIAKTPQTI